MRRHHIKLFIALSNIFKRLLIAQSQPHRKKIKMTHGINVWKYAECCHRDLTNTYQHCHAHIIPKENPLASNPPKRSSKGPIVCWIIQTMAWTFGEHFPLHSAWLESSNQHLAKVKSQCERALPGDCAASLMALFGAWPAQPVDTILFRLFRLPGPIWSQFMISDSVHLSAAASSIRSIRRVLSPVLLLCLVVTGPECVPESQAEL